VTIYPIRVLGDPVLKERGADVEAFDSSLQTLCDDMLQTMYEAPGVGLAAPQIGLSLRLFVYDPGDGSGPGAVANPELTLLEGRQEEEEGCLSIPGLYFATPRALQARVEGRDVHGQPIVVEAEGLLARIFQHETDHVNGLLFIDRLPQTERREAMAHMRHRDLGGG
jgi:peptide deformylase